MATRPLVLVAVLSAGVSATAQQVRDAVPLPSAVGTGFIGGIVVSADSPAAPMRRATVELTPDGGSFQGSYQCITDDAGKFSFANLPAANYRLSASKRGYVDIWYGAKRPNDWNAATSIALAAGQRITNLVVKQPRGAIITGRVLDLNGQPAARANVQVFRSSLDWRSGLRQFIGQDGVEADDRGIYRIFGLPPGDYIVSASTTEDRTDFRVPTSAEWQWIDAQLRTPGTSPQTAQNPPTQGPTMAYAPVFFPGTPVQANAGVLTVGAGEERSAVDIKLDLVPTAKIDGTIRGPEGIATAGANIRLLQGAEAGTGAFQIAAATSDADGHFAFYGVPPGTYIVSTRAKAANTPGNAPATTWALSDVAVNGHDANVSLDLQPGLPITGRVTFEGVGQPPADYSRTRIALIPLAAGGSALSNPFMLQSIATVDATGKLSFTDVSPGRYRVTGFAGQGLNAWRLRSAMIGGVDAADAYVEIKAGERADMAVSFTDRPTELSGVLQDASARPAPDYFIILFPADERLWMAQSRRIVSVRPASDGKYRLPDLAGGDYLLSAVTDVEQFQWNDPAFLTQLKAAAIRITIAEGDKKIQDLKIR